MTPRLGKLYRHARKLMNNPGLVLPRMRPLAETPDVGGDRFAFVAGVHRSGTSILHRLLREHPDTSGFANTRVPEDEGQYLQTVYAREAASGGPGQFAFDPDAHMTESSPLATSANREKLLREWGPYYDLTRRVLLEKTPTNFIRTRFLQALMPGCRFVFIVRHPIVSGLSTHAWTRRSGIDLKEVMRHWVTAHEIFLDDLKHIENWTLIRYEDLVADPMGVMADVFGFLGLEPFTVTEQIRDGNEPYFASWQNEAATAADIEADLQDATNSGFFARFGYRLSPPYVDTELLSFEKPSAA